MGDNNEMYNKSVLLASFSFRSAVRPADGSLRNRLKTKWKNIKHLHKINNNKKYINEHFDIGIF